MYTGWIGFGNKGIELDRRLRHDERYVELERQRQPGIEPDEMASLIHFNSTYADFIDRRYRLRGMVATTAGIVVSLFLIGAGTIMLSFLLREVLARDDVGWLSFTVWSLVFSAMCFGFPWFAWRYMLRHDFFTYTHYPIRFNRKTRMVHAFRHNGPGGVVSVPWEQAFFFIGEGVQQKYIRDLRCHVLDGNTVKETFMVGHYFDDTQVHQIKSLWEFIHRYMDEGPVAVTRDPRDRYLRMSIGTDWLNCYVWVVSNLGAFYSLRYILFPFVGLLTLTRWLVFKSSKVPEWPPEIEAESEIEADDPNRWLEPKYMGAFDGDPKIAAWSDERLRRLGK
jgi:hypothetical protein